MNKELTPLEAWRQIFQTLSVAIPFADNSEIYKWFTKVKTALKDYEMEHTLRIRLENINYELVRENEKKLKALEIIKRKMVIPPFIRNTKNVEKYNKWLRQMTFKKDYQKRTLTQEEYDLLKEVLK